MAVPGCSFHTALRVTRRTAHTAPRALSSLVGANIPRGQLWRSCYRGVRSVGGYGERRTFSGGSVLRLQTKELDEEALKSLKVNKKRLMDDLHHTCQWGTGKRWGK